MDWSQREQTTYHAQCTWHAATCCGSFAMSTSFGSCFFAEFFIPAGILLKCFLDVSDKELFDMLVLGAAKVRYLHVCSCNALRSCLEHSMDCRAFWQY